MFAQLPPSVLNAVHQAKLRAAQELGPVHRVGLDSDGKTDRSKLESKREAKRTDKVDDGKSSGSLSTSHSASNGDGDGVEDLAAKFGSALRRRQPQPQQSQQSTTTTDIGLDARGLGSESKSEIDGLALGLDKIGLDDDKQKDKQKAEPREGETKRFRAPNLNGRAAFLAEAFGSGNTASEVDMDFLFMIHDQVGRQSQGLCIH